MPRTKAERWAAYHEASLIEFDAIQEAQRDERLQCLQDRRFYSIAGAQWEGPLGQQFENKPKLEVNKIHLSVIRIINEYRNNRIDVQFEGRGSDEDDDLADACAGLYRSDEQDCTAEEAYDNAFEEGVGGGMGAWRLRADYEDDEDAEDEQQRIFIEPIFDADITVFFDLQAKRYDKADAKRCYVLTSMSRDAYREEYDDDPTSWPQEIHQREFDWSTPDVVYVCEKYEVEEKTVEMHTFTFLDGSEEKYTKQELESTDNGERPPLSQEIRSRGGKETAVRKVKTRKVAKWIMSGGGILRECGYIAGKHIPIIPFYGKRWYVDNIERMMGHVRLSKDIQRLKNMQISKAAEISALSSVEKPIVTPEQIAGHQEMWRDDNLKNYPYLLINPIKDENGNESVSGPVGYTRSPEIPPAMAALLGLTNEDIQELLGNQQQGEQMQGGISTETAHLIQNRLDMQTFIYLSNFAKSMKRAGEVWLSMAKDVFVEEGRQMKTIGSAGEKSTITLMQPDLNDNQQIIYKNDLSKAKLGVTVDVGPSSSTRKAATIRSLTQVLGLADDAETKTVLTSMVMMNMEGEGVTDVREFFRKKLIKMGVVEPTKEEAKQLQEELQSQPPDPNTQYLQAIADKEHAETLSEFVNQDLTLANIEKARAAAAKDMSEIDRRDWESMIAIVNALGPNTATAPPSGREEPQ